MRILKVLASGDSILQQHSTTKPEGQDDTDLSGWLFDSPEYLPISSKDLKWKQTPKQIAGHQILLPHGIFCSFQQSTLQDNLSTHLIFLKGRPSMSLNVSNSL